MSFAVGSKVTLAFNDSSAALADMPPVGTVGVVDSVGSSGCPGELFSDSVWVCFHEAGFPLVCECDPAWLRAGA